MTEALYVAGNLNRERVSSGKDKKVMLNLKHVVILNLQKNLRRLIKE
jgi:hypothetical protein